MQPPVLVTGGFFFFRKLASLRRVSADRIDKWLWAVRVFKTRGLAADACRAEKVKFGDQPAKPSRDVRVGDLLSVRQGVVTRTLKVTGIPRSRVGAALVPQYCLELTPPEEFEKARAQPVQDFLAREKGAGRPTKKERRALDSLWD